MMLQAEAPQAEPTVLGGTRHGFRPRTGRARRGPQRQAEPLRAVRRPRRVRPRKTP
jgi:hypothetical protein